MGAVSGEVGTCGTQARSEAGKKKKRGEGTPRVLLSLIQNTHLNRSNETDGVRAMSLTDRQWANECPLGGGEGEKKKRVG